EKHSPGDLPARLLVAVLLTDAEVRAHDLEDRQEGNDLAVGGSVRFVDADATSPAALGKLVAEAALARSGVRDDPHDLAVALERACQRRLEARHLGLAPHEAREPARARGLETRAHRPHTLELVDPQRLPCALDGGRPEVAEPEEARDQPRRMLG